MRAHRGARLEMRSGSAHAEPFVEVRDGGRRRDERALREEEARLHETHPRLNWNLQRVEVFESDGVARNGLVAIRIEDAEEPASVVGPGRRAGARAANASLVHEVHGVDVLAATPEVLTGAHVRLLRDERDAIE